jgi:hypothetical protein
MFFFSLPNFQRLQAKVIKIVDVSYGGENGFNQAIELASDALANVKFIQEKKLIGKSIVEFLLSLEYFTVISISECILFNNKMFGFCPFSCTDICPEIGPHFFFFCFFFCFCFVGHEM